MEANCIIAFFRTQTKNVVQNRFVVKKCQIAPIKEQTIPKLPLQAALFAVRFRQLDIEGHDINIVQVCH